MSAILTRCQYEELCRLARRVLHAPNDQRCLYWSLVYSDHRFVYPHFIVDAVDATYARNEDRLSVFHFKYMALKFIKLGKGFPCDQISF